MKVLNITLDVSNTSDQIVDNFVFILGKMITERYPEIKFTDKSWFVEEVELKKE
jgi:hypothetical protein